jgi:hypothetical protein
MSDYGMPLTIGEAFTVVKRTAEEEARRADHERLMEENRGWLLACSASSALNQTFEHLRDDEVALADRISLRDLLVANVESAQNALAENDREIERQSSLALPFASAA